MTQRAILLVNLGTPDSTQVSDVKKYLKEFLMDPYVIDKSVFIRYPLVNWIIAPLRSPKSAEAYKKVWTEKGSPLLVFSEELRFRLQEELGQDTPVELGMRYGSPSIRSALEKLKSQGCEEIFCLPLYPQYAESSTETAVDEIKTQLKQLGLKGEMKDPFYKEDQFIKSYGELIKDQIEHFNPDHLLLSYHGLPERHILKLDPECGECLRKSDCDMRPSKTCYRSHCFQTTHHLKKFLGLEDAFVSTSFQSRLGRDPWIKPFTDHHINDLADRGVKRLLVACPSFTTDCLETLEEIGIGLREDFLKLGGEDFALVPCLNSSDTWVKTLNNWSVDWLRQPQDLQGVSPLL